MSMPMLIINFEDFTDVIKRVLDNEYLKMNTVPKGNTTIDLTGDLLRVEVKLATLINDANTQYRNIEQLKDDLSELITHLASLLHLEESEIGQIREKLQTIIDEQLTIRQLLTDYTQQSDANGDSKFIALRREILNNQDILTYTFNVNILLKSIFIYQSNYNFQDCWSLKLNDTYLFKNIYSKFVEENKKFNTALRVSQGDILTFEFNNNSSEQKIINYDIEYIMLT